MEVQRGIIKWVLAVSNLFGGRKSIGKHGTSGKEIYNLVTELLWASNSIKKKSSNSFILKVNEIRRDFLLGGKTENK